MSKIKVDVELNGSAFTRGLDGIRAVGDKFRTDFLKKMSVSNVAKGLLQGIGLGGVEQIVDKITEPWKLASEYAEKIALSTKRAVELLKAGIAIRNAESPERQLAAGLSSQNRLRKEVEARQRAANSMPDEVFTRGVPTPNVKKLEALQELQDISNELQEQSNTNEVLRKQIDNRNELLAEENARLRDNRAVLRGEITEMEAAERELSRRQNKASRSRFENGGGVTTTAAENEALKQQIEIARLRIQEKEKADKLEAQDEKQSVRAISSDSLARVGGGGRVFGQSEPMLREAQNQTKLLTRITNAVEKPSGVALTFRR